MATDGLWNFVNPQRACQVCVKISFFGGNAGLLSGNGASCSEI